MTQLVADLLAVPYRMGGRDPATGLDCLGLVGLLALRRGLPWQDPWLLIAAAWERGEWCPPSGFLPGWRRVDRSAELLEDDVLLTQAAHHGCAFVHAGHLWTTNPHVGHPFGVPLHRKRPHLEVWRHDRPAPEGRPAR